MTPPLNHKLNMAYYSVNYANPPNHMDHNEFIAQVLCRCSLNAKNGLFWGRLAMSK